MGVDATAAATAVTEAGHETATLLPREILKRTHLSGHCGPGHLGLGSISGLRDGPCRQGRGEGRRGPRRMRYKEVGVRREGKEGRPDGRRGQPRGQGRGGKKGGGRRARGNRGRKQCSRRGPGRVPFPKAATKV